MVEVETGAVTSGTLIVSLDVVGGRPKVAFVGRETVANPVMAVKVEDGMIAPVERGTV